MGYRVRTTQVGLASRTGYTTPGGTCHWLGRLFLVRPLAVLSLALVLNACGGGGALAPGGVSADGERDGVRIHMDLDRGAIRPGETVWATIRIENASGRSVTWVGGGCNIPARVVGSIDALADEGRTWTGAPGELKKRALQNGGPSLAVFHDEQSWNQRAQGGMFCTLDLRLMELAAGAALSVRAAWDGRVGTGSAPDGAVTVTATFPMGHWDSPKPVTVSAPIQVRGSSRMVTPGQAIDAAFDDGRMVRWLDRQPGAANPYAKVEGFVVLESDTWVIRAAETVTPSSTGRSAEIEVRVRASDAKVLSVVER